MLNATHLSEVEPDHVSKTSFIWKDLNSFQIMDDGKTLVGIRLKWAQNSSYIVVEDITTKKKGYFLIRISQIEEFITNILIDENNSCLFFGTQKGKLFQYCINFEGTLGRILKDHGDLGLGKITASYSLGDVAVFGGDRGMIGFIDVRTRNHLGNKMHMAPQKIKSIQLCWVQSTKFEPKALLTVCGKLYSQKPDVLDVTHFISDSFKTNLKRKAKSDVININNSDHPIFFNQSTQANFGKIKKRLNNQFSQETI